MVDYKLIGERLQRNRKERKLTQEVVAECANVTVVYLSKIENGRVRPTIETLDAICQAIGCDLGQLFSDVSPASEHYQTERVVNLFRACPPQIKPVALNLLEQLSLIQ